MLISTYLYNSCAGAYVLALFIYALNLSLGKELLRRLATTIVALGVITQTTGMAFRWYEAGLVELEAYTQSTGETLSGEAYWQVLTQHPPWSNLYEIMVYMGWGLVLVFLACEIKWKPKFIGVFSLLIALTTLGIASLTNGQIKPLVPALKSWWIMIHVISASIAYAAGTLAAIASLLYLVKAQDQIKLSQIASGVMGVSAFIIFILGRGFTLFSTQDYLVKSESSPGVGWLLIINILLCIAASALLRHPSPDLAKPKSPSPTRGEGLYLLATLSTLSSISLIIFNQKINIWDLGLFGIIAIAQIFIGLAILKPTKLRALIPEAEQLDHIAYSNILVAFALMVVVLVTGALWAHYAWGRYWAWDPKETGALVIWLTYALYLHTRVTYGWGGPKSAVIAIAGFFVIIAGFLGVNLGWFADGLHSYGSS